MPIDYFQGTKALLQNLIENERQQKLRQQQPDYQAAVLKLAETKKNLAWQDTATRMAREGKFTGEQLADPRLAALLSGQGPGGALSEYSKQQQELGMMGARANVDYNLYGEKEKLRVLGQKELQKSAFDYASKLKTIPTAGSSTPEDFVGVVEAVKKGELPPVISTLASFRDRGALSREFAKQGINLTKLNSDWAAMQRSFSSMNGPQQLRLRQALESVSQSIPALEKISDEFERYGWTPANYAQIQAAKTGTDPTKRDLATKYLTQIGTMKSELAQAYSGGYAPTLEAQKWANQVLNPLYGSKQMRASLDQLKIDNNIRLNAINSIQPFMPGGISPQYQNLINTGNQPQNNLDQDEEAIPQNNNEYINNLKQKYSQ